MSPKQKHEDVETRLLGFWERNEEFGRPIGCVATAFTFDAGFFEEQCLTRFAGVESDPTEEFAAYVVEREEKLSEVFACVIVDQGHVAPLRSLRWNLLPLRVPSGGIMHARVTILAWEHHVRVLIGSANVTPSGYQQNFENTGVLDFTPSGKTPLALLEEIIGFIEGLLVFAPPTVSTGGLGPQSALRRHFQVLRRSVANWTSEAWERDEPQAIFVPLGPGGTSL